MTLTEAAELLAPFYIEASAPPPIGDPWKWMDKMLDRSKPVSSSLPHA